MERKVVLGTLRCGGHGLGLSQGRLGELTTATNADGPVLKKRVGVFSAALAAVVSRLCSKAFCIAYSFLLPADFRTRRRT